MVFKIIWSESAARQLGKLDRSVAKRILERVQALESDPLRSLRRLVGVPSLPASSGGLPGDS